jgi:hypothetical protein
VVQYGGRVPEYDDSLPEIEKFNIKIMTSSDWGINPGKMKGQGNIAVRPLNRPELMTSLKS